MNILLLGDYSNLHPCLAVGLRSLGHQVTVASDGCEFMDTPRDYSLHRPLPGPAGGALLFMRMLASGRLRGYDVVSLIGSSFVTLRPHLLRLIYRNLRRHNGSVFLNITGNDRVVMDFLTLPECPLDYCEYWNRLNGTLYNQQTLASDLLWTRGDIGRWCDELYHLVDGITTATYEYQLAVDHCLPEIPHAYTGIPISQPEKMHQIPSSGPLKLFLGRKRHRMAYKGTDILGRVAQRVADDLPHLCSLDIVENMTFADYTRAQQSADIVIDQLYSYTPATNALQAMANGQVVISGAENDYYKFIKEPTLRPIINVRPGSDDEIEAVIRSAVSDRDAILHRVSQGREFVARHNATDVVAQRFLNFWESRL